VVNGGVEGGETGGRREAGYGVMRSLGSGQELPRATGQVVVGDSDVLSVWGRGGKELLS